MEQQISNGFRLAPQQARLWRLYKANSDCSELFYCVCCLASLEGLLDSELLRSALLQVLNRHEILRTRFSSLPGMTIPLQVIADTVSPVLLIDDFSALDPAAHSQHITQQWQSAKLRRYDPERDFPLHTRLIVLTSTQHCLLLSLPALCADSTSLDLLVKEICQAYKG